VCFKLANRNDAEQVLENAISVDPNKEYKYRSIYNNARMANQISFMNKDCSGFISNIDHSRSRGEIEDKTIVRPFRWYIQNERFYRYLETGDNVFFDLSSENQVLNIEPSFESID
jgi:hypothetical protein